MAKQFVPVLQVTLDQPVTWILMSAPLVCNEVHIYFRLNDYTFCAYHHISTTTYLLNATGANPCEHGGRCLNTKGSFQCKCLQGYEGPRCEMDVNECMSNPCHNDATCLDQIGGFHCICMPGTFIDYTVWKGKG